MAEKQFLTKKGYEERVALLENLKVVRRKEVHRSSRKQESRVTYQRMPSMMQQRTSSVISRHRLLNLKTF